MGAAFLQTTTETLPGSWALVLYLIPAGVALGIIIALLVRKRRRRGQGADNDDSG